MLIAQNVLAIGKEKLLLISLKTGEVASVLASMFPIIQLTMNLEELLHIS